MAGKPQTHERRRVAITAAIRVNNDGCWIWNAYTLPSGYGQVSLDGQKMYAHRASYILHLGPIPDGLHIDHECHTRDKSCEGGSTCLHRRCVNPSHLAAVTQGENNKRAAELHQHCRRCGNKREGIRKNGDSKNFYCLVCNRRRATETYTKKREANNITKKRSVVR